MDRFIGRLLDNRYEILEVIGVGGMAVVYKARCHRLNRLVAVKILKDEYSQDEEFRRRFHAEGQAVAMLSHPNIVSVYDVSTSDDADYIVMELIDGISLKQYMESKGVLNWKETLHFAIQIAKALEHAHNRGIVHRDIKPHNVMVLKNGSVKVADFGIARVMSKSNTLTKEALGSVHYISPEQAKGARVDSRSDIYSLGIVMYEMMTGRPPYDGDSPVSIAIQHINGKPAMPSTLNPNIPGGLEQIIMHAIAQNPDDRYPSATAMLYDMDEFRKNPAILFDYQNPHTELDAAAKLAGAQEPEDATVPLPKEFREQLKSVQTRPEQPPVRRKKTTARRREEIVEEDEEHSSKIATVAVVACAVLAVVAIAIFLAVFLGKGLGGGEVIQTPNLLGLTQEEFENITDVIIRVGDKEYSDEYAKGQVMYQNPSPNESIAKGGIVTVKVSLGPKPQEKVMEDLSGMDSEKAKQFLQTALNLQEEQIVLRTENSSTVDEGLVTRTEPADGEVLADGQTVTVWISTGPEVRTSKVPNVVGTDSDMAKSLLSANGFDNVVLKSVDSNRPKGTVVRQSVEAQEEIDVTTEIVLQVSNGSTGEDLPPASTADPTLVTKLVTVELSEDLVMDYKLSLWLDGEMIEERLIPGGALSTQFELTGKGTVTYELRVNGSNPTPLVVNFDE